tara:strand:- start:2442 stop:2585 length:144 start_codon:yes stop_codon:yes gene_type:complete
METGTIGTTVRVKAGFVNRLRRRREWLGEIEVAMMEDEKMKRQILGH